MPRSRGRSGIWRRGRSFPLPAKVVLLTLGLALIATPARTDTDVSPREALEKAGALARDGHHDEARAYLADLVSDEGGPLAREAEVLLEAARLSTEVEEVRSLAGRAAGASRDARMLHAAHMLLGDSYFAEGLYVTAAGEYELAARHAPGRGPGSADLKRARSVLASGDAEAAIEAYEDIIDASAATDDTRPEAMLGLGNALLKVGRSDEAAYQLERTAAAFPEHHVRVEALFAAARSYAALGDVGRSGSALQLLIDDYPDSYEAVLAREELRELEPALADTSAPADTTAPGHADSLPETPAR
jgi:TolA-binding protein